MKKERKKERKNKRRAIFLQKEIKGDERKKEREKKVNFFLKRNKM